MITFILLFSALGLLGFSIIGFANLLVAMANDTWENNDK